ncbi:DUF4064 domain-containing protein [Bacillus sp. T33-2]|uniref:DUF4064 domain-containing protein n=1 Tax=Bacillus sp. T33-2 TaxID=2054168 RepID=UPI0015E09DCD|nr:DUF4064 domain-containing protein [Bacillus sp. T33-2]
MKRRAEKITGFIGMLLYGFLILIGGAVIAQQDHSEFIMTIRDTAKEGPSMESVDVDGLIDLIGTAGWLLLIVSAAAIVLGILAVAFLNRNTKPKAAGTIFLVVGALSILATVGLAAFPGILYIVAGIMCLARKPRQEYR